MSQLALTQLTLSHFRSHQIGQITVDPRPVAIFGDNGSGKTNILEAVSLFSPGRGLRRATAEDMARKPESLGWKLTGHVQSNGQPFEVEVWAEPNTTRQLRIDGKAAAQTALASVARVLWLVPSMDRLWQEGAEGRRRFLDRMALSFFPDHAQATLTYEKAMRERNRLLKDQVRDPHWYTALETQMAQCGWMLHQNRAETLLRLDAAQSAAQTAFPRADLEMSQADGGFGASETDLRDAFAESRFRDLAAGRTLVGPHRSDLWAVYRSKSMQAKECSTGEQKALLISLVLANARGLIDEIGAAPIVLLDEVAAHLDADRRAALYDEICALGAQAWMTGTGPELFDSLGARAQYLKVHEENGFSQITQIEALSG